MNTPLQPGNTIGVLGGGQLGRMLILEGRKMGYRFVVLDPASNSPAGQVADEQIIGAYDDCSKARELARKSDLIIYEFENIDPLIVEGLEKEKPVPQGSKLLATTRHRKLEKEALVKAEVPVAPFVAGSGSRDFQNACEQIHFPAILKTATGGYDGKGQWRIASREIAIDIWQETGLGTTEQTWILEEEIPFVAELSVMVARNDIGETRTFEPTLNIHRNHILHLSLAPAPVEVSLREKAQKLATQIAEQLQLVGILGVEMFLLENGEILVNELAPRPHNSGHYTYDACTTSQFEMMLRAVTGHPLPEPTVKTAAVMGNLLGEHQENFLAALPNLSPHIKIHWYGKNEAKQGRKMGHLTALAPTVEEALHLLDQTAIWEPYTNIEKQMMDLLKGVQNS
ncbi:5-(carboxyamino)imidazole ribonucleotide synthase [Risungbinella massiliensis]|uniref:5-(carboxyamino)imidazole ribonucleotide synthase n=1 Tax=Risungbinella massiliensis TaxID=1329796 RepID=UPI0005CBA1B8|nr:5-(carboxyamino)imidazole ribonucleotide synthase [Risungbinella massiliensis]